MKRFIDKALDFIGGVLFIALFLGAFLFMAHELINFVIGVKQ